MRKRGVAVVTVLPSCNYPTLVKQQAAGAPDVSLLFPHNKRRRGKDSSKINLRRAMFKTK